MAMPKLGRYEIVGELGHGAMGVVYKATDPKLGRTVALKTIDMSIDPAEKQEYEARFHQEAKAAGSLNHPNIVTIYDIGDSGERAYLAMELLEGVELRTLMNDGRGIKVAQAVDVARQVADGLAFAHERGIIHRDIKPANIMVLHHGPVKIMDFGIARMRAAEVQTQTGTLMGSPEYISPEQVIGKRADHRADIFSLGVILYEMLAGAPPFSGDSLSGLMYQIVNFVPPAPSAVNREVPKLLDYIVAKMLAKTVEQRYAGAAAVATDLRECARQLAAPQSGDAARALLIPPPPQLIGNDTRNEILAQPVPRTRQNEGVDVIDEAPVIAISRDFDSMEATQLLATRSGMDQAFNEYTTTLNINAPAAPAHKAAPMNKSAPPTWKMVNQGSRSSWLGWTGRELWILAATAACGLAVAAAIVLR